MNDPTFQTKLFAIKQKWYFRMENVALLRYQNEIVLMFLQNSWVTLESTSNTIRLRNFWQETEIVAKFDLHHFVWMFKEIDDLERHWSNWKRRSRRS